jgi:hypothetical protein
MVSVQQILLVLWIESQKHKIGLTYIVPAHSMNSAKLCVALAGEFPP